jgi:hypothetical protein
MAGGLRLLGLLLVVLGDGRFFTLQAGGKHV